MGKRLIFNYTFDASAQTITLPDIFAQKRFLLITNVTSGTIIYQFNDSASGIQGITFDYENSTTTITLAYDTTAMSDSDQLQILVEEESTDVTINDRFVDPVSKIRVSNPENLIDTDFEYGLQSTKWETLELTNNIPTFFSRSGDFDIELESMNVQAGSDVVTVVTAAAHNLQRGSPIIVQASGSVSADGGFVVGSVLSTTAFNYKAKSNFIQTRSIKDQFTQLFPGSIYSGTEFKLTNIGGITTDGVDPSTLTVNTVYPTDFNNGTSMALSNTFAKSTIPFDTDNVVVDNVISVNESYTNATPTGETGGFNYGGVAAFAWQPRPMRTVPTANIKYFTEDEITVNSSADTITFPDEHGFANLDLVTYICDSSTNTPISGAYNMRSYYVYVIDAYTIKLQRIRTTSSSWTEQISQGVFGGVSRSCFASTFQYNYYYGRFTYAFQVYADVPSSNYYTYPIANEVGSTGSEADGGVISTRINDAYSPFFGLSTQIDGRWYGPNGSGPGVSNPYGKNSNYDYYLVAYSFSGNSVRLARLRFSDTSTNYLRYTSSYSYSGGFMPISYNVQRCSLWLPNHGFTKTEVGTITATTGTLPNPLSSGSSYQLVPISSDRLAVNDLSGNAIVFTTAGSINLVYNIQATIAIADANTIEIPGTTLNEGDAISYDVNGGTAIGGLVDGTTYYAALKSGDKFKISTTQNVYGATATNLAQNSFTWVNLTNNYLLLDSNPYSTGDAVIYASTAPISGLESGRIYWVRDLGSNNIALYNSEADANANTNRVDLYAYGSGKGDFTGVNIVDITSAPSPAESHIFVADFIGAADGNYTVSSTSSDGLTFDFSANNQIQARSKVVTAQTANAIPLDALYIPDHGFITGDSLTFTTSGTTNISGLTSGDTYYAVRANKDFLQFATSEDNALDGTIISLTETGSSTSELTGTITLQPTTIVGSFVGQGTISFEGGSNTINGLESTFTSYFNKGDSFFINIPETETDSRLLQGFSSTTDLFTAVGHGLSTGDMIVFSGTSAPGNINFSNVYFANAASADTFSVHYTATDANSNTNKVQLTSIGTNVSVTGKTDVGSIHESTIEYVNSDDQITTSDSLPSTGQTDTTYLQTTALLLRPDGFALHRPYDGGVELIPPTNPDSRMIRQTRKYFRYQSGKGIQVSFAVNFSPTSQIDTFTRSGNVGTITTRFPHRLSAGLEVNVSGSTNVKDTISYQTIDTNVGEDADGNPIFDVNNLEFPLTLLEGRTYRFDQSDSSNTGYQILFSTEQDGTHNPSGTGTEYTTGVTKVGTPGSDGAYTQIVVATDAPILYTYDASQSGMGFQVNTDTDPENNKKNLWNGDHEVLSIVNDFTYTVQLDGTPTDSTARGVVEYYVKQWENSALRCGLFDDQNGIFFEYDGSTLYCCRRSSIRQLSGYANVQFRSSEIIGTDTKFSSQLNVGDYIVIKGQTHRVSKISGDNLMYIVPSYRGVESEKVIMTKTETTRIPQTNWSLDVCDGTGYTGFNLDIHKIQMAYVDYSWYGAGKVRFGFKDQHGNVRYVHSFVHGNFFTEAYMRSGNIPARYEIQNVGNPTYVPALAHWGTSVIMDGRFDSDKAYVFNASSPSITLTGQSQLTADGKVTFTGVYQAYISRGWRSVGYAISLDSSSATLNQVNAGTVITGADLDTNTSAANPSSTYVTPYQPYLPSVFTYEGRNQNGGIRNLLLINKPPTGTSGTSTTYNIGAASGGEVNVTKDIPLISIRLAPSVDTSAPGFLGEREIINRMQLILNTVGILSTHAANIKLILNGQLSSNDWERVTPPSLSQVIYHLNTDTISGGLSVYNFDASGGSGETGRQPVLTTEALGEIATLGNSILGGDNVYPDGPDVLTVVATLSEDPSTVTGAQPFQVSGRIGWTESQA